MTAAVLPPPISRPSPADLPLEQLEREIAEQSRELAAAMGAWLLLVAEFDRRGGAREWGCRGTAEWLSWRCGVSPRAAREHVRVARGLEDLPRVTRAFVGGELSYSKVRAITRVATPDNEDSLLELATRSTATEVERIVRSFRTAPSADLDVANRGHARRYLEWWWEEDGSLSFRGRLGADDGAALVNALEAAADAMCAGAEHPPPLGARRADALAEIAHSGSPRAQVVLHVDGTALAGDGTEGEVCALEHGPTVPCETARRLACDSELLIASGQEADSLDAGRKRRVVSPALRTALERRDRGCCFPGCDRTHGLHGHHIEHWARGGRTDRENLVLLCRFHHRLVHEGGFTMTRLQERLRFRRPDGRAIPEVPAPP